MPFVRRKRGQLLVVHSRRGREGKVQQVVLHAFMTPEELRGVLGKEGWRAWKESMAWQHPACRWDWPALRSRLAEELEAWGAAPTGAVARRENRVQQLATDLEARLRPLTAAGVADAAVIDGARAVLAELHGTLGRLLEPRRSRHDLHEVDLERKGASTSREAERLFDEGMEHWWAGDRRAACRWFKKALAVDPEHADAHNHLGIRCFDEGRLKQAERHFVAAIEGGARSILQEAGQVEWGFLENRPYLRGLANLGLVRHRQGNHAAEAEIYERLLRMSPNDHQGVRWLLGAAYHRLGRLEVAIKAYEAALDEPGCCYSLALALHEQGSAGAGLAVVRALAANRYVAPMLLGERWERLDAWHSSNMEEPEWAADYVSGHGDLWRRAAGSAELLRRWRSAAPVRRWLEETAEVRRELAGLEPGERRSWLVNRLHGLCAEGNLRVVASEVDPESTGGRVPVRRAHVARLDEVRIERRGDHAVIEYLDRAIETVHLKLDDAQAMSDAEILEAHNEVLERMEQARAEYEHVAVEIPPGKPQIRYEPEAGQWVPRGDVLRCVVSDSDREARVIIDGRELTQAEFGRMLTTFSGWGMRIVFVPDDELATEPPIEVKDPDDPDAASAPTFQPWIPGGPRGPRPSA